ncbi:GntR family transcriptional regulator [Fructobacillus americanaquae]|uniref:GntR family transcriptional regulator n=1 Tax=Fructobacillus americanaquae TaxID=2940302 RepID=A0ABY5BZX3_9LACO|nr:GntR family transcriptional regulator [Fructobacillus americanaquae]USS91410.1 GntR family transcriptional regulator [Fructobacillus americanaquae]
MSEAIYVMVQADIKQKIYQGHYKDLKLPDERTLAADYQVSRSSIKRALNVLVQQGIIFKKRGSGTFVNPLYLKNQAIFQHEGSNLGVSDSFRINGQAPSIELLDFRVIQATPEQQSALFLNDGDFVYEIKRLRKLDGVPFMIEYGYVPISLLPGLNRETVTKSIYEYVEKRKSKTVTRSFMTIMTEPSNVEEQKLLKLKATEPVGIMEGIFFMDDGTPLEYSNMRLHYKYLRYNAFVSLGSE